MSEKYIEKVQPEFEDALKFLKEELDKIRTDRATPSLVEDIVVDCFDQRLPLKQLAAISCPEERQIVIDPFNNDYIKDIVSAINKANDDLNPVPQEGVIRIKLPSMTQEYREKLINDLSELREEARVSIKRAREKVWKQAQEAENNGEITEDDKYRVKDQLQELVDEYNEDIDELINQKKDKIKS